MPISPRQSSIVALEKLLTSLLTGTAVCNDDALRAACKSQGELAKYENSELGIRSCSLNTLKSSADQFLDGGYKRLDSLRFQFLRKLRQALAAPPPSAPKGENLKEQLRIAKADGDALREDILLLDWVLNRLLTQARSYADESGVPALVERCKIEQREALMMLSRRITAPRGKDAGTD